MPLTRARGTSKFQSNAESEGISSVQNAAGLPTGGVFVSAVKNSSLFFAPFDLLGHQA